MTRKSDQIVSGAPLRIGVLGAGGQLGSCLLREIESSSGAELAFATTRDDLDLTALDELDAWLDDRLDQPGAWPLDVVINAAALTKVDSCESEAEHAYQVNALAPATWARTLAQRDVRFLHVSTDYVFAGNGPRPYCEDDPTDPRTVYGKSKRAGEVAVLGSHPSALVIRTSWVFGPGRNFVEAILEQASKRVSGEVEGPLRVVDDQIGSPTAATDLAAALVQICVSPVPELRSAKGLLHLCNSGVTTWFGFAKKILELSGNSEVVIEAVPTSAFKTAAPRPANSVLDVSRAAAMGIEFRPWYEALASYLDRGARPSAVSVDPNQKNARNHSAQEVQR